MTLTRQHLLHGRWKSDADQAPVVICIFQRGAADGLNSLIPYGDDDYYRARPTLAVASPQSSSDSMDVDGFFALPQASAALKHLYDQGQLALIPACGLPHGSRSHFDAQALVESGVTSKTQIELGWLGRYLQATAQADDALFRAAAISGSVPRALLGAPDPLAVSSLGDFGLGDLGGSPYQTTLDSLYSPATPYAEVAQSALGAMDILATAQPEQFAPENGADYPSGELGPKLLQAAQIIKANMGAQIICLDVGGWDHHENQANFLPGSLSGLAQGLEALHTDLGTRMQHVTAVVMTEFGRRVAENGSRGTDHGSAGLVYALGAGVNGGQIHGRWPGLAPPQLELGEDLAISTDLRSLMIQVLSQRLGYAQAGDLFPGFVPAADTPVVFSPN